MSGNMFSGIGVILAFGVAFIILLALSLPFAIWWAYTHIQVVLR